MIEVIIVGILKEGESKIKTIKLYNYERKFEK